VGLLYHQPALDAAWDLVKNWTAEERQSLRNAVPAAGLDATIRGRTIRALSVDILQIARDGLEARGLTGCKGKHEAAFLDILDETVTSGKTASDELIDLYEGPWNGDVTRVFRDFAY
jgi:glutamate--cysteine ligase